MTGDTSRPHRRVPIGRWALKGAAALALAFILLPLVLVTWLAFFRQEIPSFPPEGYSLAWFGAVLDNKSFVGGFVLSAEVAVAATVIGLALAVPASLLVARRGFAAGGRSARCCCFPSSCRASSSAPRSTCSRSRPSSRPDCRCSVPQSGSSRRMR